MYFRGAAPTALTFLSVALASKGWPPLLILITDSLQASHFSCYSGYKTLKSENKTANSQLEMFEFLFNEKLQKMA